MLIIIFAHFFFYIRRSLSVEKMCVCVCDSESLSLSFVQKGLRSYVETFVARVGSGL